MSVPASINAASDEQVQDAQNALKAEAAEALENGQLQLAEAKLTEAINLGCSSALLYSRRAKLLLKLGKAAAAVEDCSAALLLNSDSGAAHKVRGKAYAKLERWEEARSDLSTALKIDYDEDTDSLFKDITKKLQGNSAAAAVSTSVPLEAFALKTEAAQALEAGLPEVALEKLTELINLGVASAALYCRRAKLLLELARPAAAVDDCSAALALSPDLSNAYKIRGRAHVQLAQWPDARSDLEAGLRLEYDADTDAALKDAKRAVTTAAPPLIEKNNYREDPKDFPAMSPSIPAGGLSEDAQAAQTAFKAEAVEALSDGKLALALDKFTEAIKLGCTSALLYGRRAKLLLELGRPRAAENDCIAALTLNPDSGSAYKIRGRACMKLEDWEDAHRHFLAGQKIDYDEETDEMAKLVLDKLKSSPAFGGQAKRKAEQEIAEELERKRRKEADSASAKEGDMDKEWMRQKEAEIAEEEEAERRQEEAKRAEGEEAQQDREWMRQKDAEYGESSSDEAPLVEENFPAMSPPVGEEGLSDEDLELHNSFKSKAAQALEDGKLDVALENFTEAIKLGCTSALLYSRRGKVLLQLERPAAAANDCTAALLLNADSGAAHKIRGKAYAQLQRWEESHHDIAAGLKIDYDEETDTLSKTVQEKVKEIHAQKEKERLRKETEYKNWMKRKVLEGGKQREQQNKRKSEIEDEREREWKRQKEADAILQAQYEATCKAAEDEEEVAVGEENPARFSLGASLGLGIADAPFVKEGGHSAGDGSCVEDSEVKIIDPSGWPVEENKRYATFDETPFPAIMKMDLKKSGFPAPSQIQQYTWPLAVQGCDVVGVAATGSGKTLAFLLPAFSYIVDKCIPAKEPTLLVIAPTRELAIQIEEEAKKFGARAGIRTMCCYGGAPRGAQAQAIRAGVHAVIGTPGRINDFLESWQLNLQGIVKLVFDEADRMLDMGFEPQIRSIVAKVPKKRNTLFFTATWPASVRKLASEFLNNAYQVQIGDRSELKGNQDITQVLKMCRPASTKNDTLFATLRQAGLAGVVNPAAKGLVFCGTKRMCDQLSMALTRIGIPCRSIHGDKSQQERESTLAELKVGRTQLLIATDVAARGLDIKGITIVINYDVPKQTADYVHRIGRTGRAGKKGLAVTLVTDADAQSIRGIIQVMRRTKQDVPKTIEHIARHVRAVMHGQDW